MPNLPPESTDGASLPRAGRRLLFAVGVSPLFLTVLLAADPVPDPAPPAWHLAQSLIPQQPWLDNAPPLGRTLPFLEAVVSDDSLPDSLRASALAHLPAPILRQRIPHLIHGISHSTPPLQHASVWALGLAGGLDAAHALEEVVRVPSKSASLRADALVARAMASTHDLTFAHAFTNAPEPELRHTAQLVLGRNRGTEVLPRPTTTASWIEATSAGGYADRGRRLFLSPQLGCGKCHAFEGRGSHAGPNLGPLPVPPTRAHLVESILEPSRRITDGFRSFALTTRDELTMTGTHPERQPDGTTTLRDASGRRIRVPATEIATLEPLDASLMPEGLMEILTVDDLRDLLSYLTEVQP